jgi:hypothetical protein
MKGKKYELPAKHTISQCSRDTRLPNLTESEVKKILVILRQTNGSVDKRTGVRKTKD